MFNIDRRLIRNFDWMTFCTIVVISLIGIMTIFSATRQPGDAPQATFYMKQIVWLLISICALVAVVSFDYIWFGRIALPLYITGILALIFVLISGRTGMGAQRWISLGPLSFQPSEFFKLIFIIMLAGYYSLQREPLNTAALLRVFFMIVFLPFVLLFKQPDLGTAVVVLMIFTSISLARGLQKKLLVTLVIISLVSLPFVGNILWTSL